MRALLALFALVFLVSCGDGRDLDEAPAALGDFKLGHSIVIAPNIVKGPLSREASDAQWIAAMDKALEDRFRRYEGADKKLYHFGVSIEGYVLAQVGVPLVLQPKSVMIFRVTVWDDEKGIKLNEEPHEITVLEPVSANTFAGSGLTQTAEEQMENLVIKGAKQLEVWLGVQQQRHGWFTAEAQVEKAEDGQHTNQNTNKAAQPVN